MSGKSIFDILAPVAGGLLGSVLLPGIGTALGAGISGLGGGAIGAGIGSGLNTGIKTGNPLAGLASGAAAGAGSYLGGSILGPEIGGIGSNSGAGTISGAASPGFMGTPLAASLGDAGLSGAGSVFGSTTPGTLAGSTIGSSVAQNTAESSFPGMYKENTQDPTPWQPTRQAQMNLPTSLSGYQNLDPLQQATNIASKGVYGGGQGKDETNYFLNLINRNLVSDTGQVAGNTESVNPVENSFLNQIGLGGYSSPGDLLQKINNYSYSQKGRKMAESYRPIFGRVLLEREVLKKVGSILLPDAEHKRQAVCKGKIVALGETAGWTKVYTESGEEKVIRVFKVGDIVSFGRHAGTWLDKSYGLAKENDEEAPYFLCQDVDILAVIEQGE